MEMNTRRDLLKNAAAAAVAVTGAAALVPSAAAQTSKALPLEKKAVPPRVVNDKPTGTPPKVPLFSSIITYGNLVFLAGVGAHFTGTIEEHTKHVLDELESNLQKAGSSMEKVLKVNVYLNDLADFQRMNTMYQGRWGAVPPVRTTVAVAKGGVPGDSLVEIDCIAFI